jgi:hypothetical protein
MEELAIYKLAGGCRLDLAARLRCPLICEVFPYHSSFSVLRGTPMPSAIHFKKQTCYER